MRNLLSKTWTKVGLALLCLPTSWAQASDGSQAASLSPDLSTAWARVQGVNLANYSANTEDLGRSLQ